MPSINEIMQVAEALEKSPVIVVRDRCLVMRNRNATCRRCADACVKDAIVIAANDITLHATSCVGCGACIAACPTEALVAAQPTDAEVVRAAMASMEANDGKAVIACARIASKRQADPERFAEVPCLSRVDETFLVCLAAEGASTVLLVDGNCSTCKHRDCMYALDNAERFSSMLLEAHGCEINLTHMTGFPDGMQAEVVEGQHDSSRRSFFAEAAGMARETAKTAAKVKLENELGYKLDERSIGERLRVTANGTLPQLRMPRHEAMLNALDSIGIPESGELDTRLFGTLNINKGKCNACSMCAVFCPTGALRSELPSKGANFLKNLEFSACDCVQCGLCVDVCWKRALTLSNSVDVVELYDFEPRKL